MQPSLKWPLILGGCAAVVNLATAFVISVCGLLFTPAAAAAASYMAAKEEPSPNGARYGARVGLATGGVASAGLLVGSALAGLFWNVPMLAFGLATARDLSDIGIQVLGSAVGALFVMILAIIVSVLSTALSAGVGAVVSSLVNARQLGGSSRAG